MKLCTRLYDSHSNNVIIYSPDNNSRGHYKKHIEQIADVKGGVCLHNNESHWLVTRIGVVTIQYGKSFKLFMAGSGGKRATIQIPRRTINTLHYRHT